MTRKSHIVNRLDHLQTKLSTVLKPLGFAKRGRTFNRQTEQGLVQVIQFGLGEVLPLPPHLARDLDPTYGTTSIGLGVFVEEVYTKDQNAMPKSVIGVGACMIRTDLGHLTERRHGLWNVDDDMGALVDEIAGELLYTGIPFLNRFSTRQQIIDKWILYNDEEDRLSQVARIDVAVILIRQGKSMLAWQLMRDQIEKSQLAGHVEYVRELAIRLGLGPL